MPRLLYDTETATLQPYPRDDDEDVVDLDPRYLMLTLHQQPQPEHDPTTHRLESTEAIDLQALTVTRDWQLVPISPPPPTPDWAAFKTVALNSATLNQILVAAYQSCPVAAGALAPALLRAEGNGSGDFAAAWATICAAVPVAPDVIAGFQQVAKSCNLPDAFVEALQPPST